MAFQFPIPKPPRTPTPPTPTKEAGDEQHHYRDNGGPYGHSHNRTGSLGGAGLGIYSAQSAASRRHSSIIYDSKSLSPMSGSFPPNSFGSMTSPMPPSSGSPALRSQRDSTSASSPGTDGETMKNPFNFQTQTYSMAPVAKSNIGQRRGHRYKHSSVSTQHQIFLEPAPRAPLALPASLPIPTFKEAWQSMSREQSVRLIWSLGHAVVAAYVVYSAAGSLALTALSHLVFFDAISATICVFVDVFCNFEVWKRSSIRHPFGLERLEVLAGFAMSVFLLFMGFDLISHNLKHVLESLGSHAPHHPHVHERVSPGSVDSAALLSIIATFVSAIGLKNHARISHALRFSSLQSLPSVLSNPSHFLTLSFSFLMLLLPLMSVSHYLWLDRTLCASIAFSMFFLGFRLAVAQGLMLLMSYSGKGVDDCLKEIASEDDVCAIEEARFWQVHYGLCMANVKLRIKGPTRGSEADQRVQKVRERVQMLVKNRLGGGYGRGMGGVKWEVTTQVTMDGAS